MRVCLIHFIKVWIYFLESIIMQVQIISEKRLKLNSSGVFLFASALLIQLQTVSNLLIYINTYSITEIYCYLRLNVKNLF